MQFQVPQFIDIEDHIFGPLTLRQFLYLVGAGGVSFMLFFVLQTWLWIILTVIIMGLTSLVAFGKYNGQPILKAILAGIKYVWFPKFYLWQYTAPGQTQLVIHTPTQTPPPGNPLKSLLLKLNTSGAATPPTNKPTSQ